MMSELQGVDRRLAVLEQSAHDTAAALTDIRAELRLMRTDIQRPRGQLHDDFRRLLRFMIGGFVGVFPLLAHGLHWFESPGLAFQNGAKFRPRFPIFSAT